MQLSGIRYKGRTVRCNDADEGYPGGKSSKSPSKSKQQKKESWRDLINSNEGRKKKSQRGFKGEEPDFSEEGWAMRKPRKKKK